MSTKLLYSVAVLMVAGLSTLGLAVLLEPAAPAQVQTLPPPYLSDANAADAPYGPTPQVDGRINPGEYAGAYQLTFPTYGGNLEVFIRQNAITLYIAFDSPDTTPFPGPTGGGIGPAFQVFLDTKHDRSALTQADDYRLTIDKGGAVREDQGGGMVVGWTPSPVVSWTAQAYPAAYGWQAEYAIDLVKAGITQTGQISIGLAVAEVWTPSWPTDWYWPSGGYYLNPSTWGNLTSSSYWSTFYWKPGPWEDYAPSGVPDFDQKQASWNLNGKATHCGPVAAADSLWWFDSKFETPDHQPPTISDTYPLVKSYATMPPLWDDHDVSNVIPFVDDLANNYFGTNQGITGTNVISMFDGLNNYLRAHQLWDDYRVTLVVSPAFPWVANEVLRSEDMILLLGFYEEVIDPGGDVRWARVGGHYVTIAGIDLTQNRIAFSDPMVDWQEIMLLPSGRVLSGTLLPHSSSGHGPLDHNDAGNISHDSYIVRLQSDSPGGLWGVYDYPFMPPLFGVNPHPTIPTEPWRSSLALQIEVEYALAVSPYTWKASGAIDYAPNGVSDIDQKQDTWLNVQTQQWSFCGPAAVANSLWWFDSKFESSPITPTTINDHYPLVSAYGAWDDHDPLNVDDPATPWTWPPMPPFNGELVEDLALRAQTDMLGSGTTITNLTAAIDQYLNAHQLRAGYTITQVESPDFWWVAEEVERSEDMILLLGFYSTASATPERVGGHYVTVAGVDKQGGLIAFSDPYWDNAETTWPLAQVGWPTTRMGRVASGTLLPHFPVPGHPPVAHNDAASVSEDVYYALSLGPGGAWGPLGYVQSTTEITSFLGMNGGGAPVAGPLETRVEWAIAVSPVADVWIQKSVTPLTVTHHTPITFTLSFGNIGSLPARNVVITDDLPTQLISATWSASLPITPVVGATTAWQAPDLAWQQGGAITISGIISAIDPQLIVTNTAVIATSSVEQDQLPSLSNRASATFTIVNPDIDIAPTGVVVTLTEGLTTTQSITVTNLGGAPLTWSGTEVPSVGWLSAAPANGVVQPHRATPITLTFDATGLFSSTYTTTLRFTSDDPDEPQIDAPITLIVPPSDIRVAPSELAITLTTGATASRWITISNVGQSTLTWSAAELPAVTWLSETPGSGAVAPSSSTLITATFNASGLLGGAYTTTLRFTSDDPDQPQLDAPITLTVLAPDIVITPTELAIILPRGVSDSRPITIANTGTATLTWILNEAPAVAWLSEVPASGQILPGNATPSNVTFDATGLMSGTYTTTLRFTSDDPDEPQLDAPITLTVLAPDIVITPTIFTVTVRTNFSATQILSITNQGNYSLTWTLIETPTVGWLNESASGGGGGLAATMPISLTFDATSLAGGIYTTALRLASNDPDQPQIDLPVTLLVPYEIYLPLIAKNF